MLKNVKKLVLTSLVAIFAVSAAHAANPVIASKDYVDSGLVQKQNKLPSAQQAAASGKVAIWGATGSTTGTKDIVTAKGGIVSGSTALVEAGAVADKIADVALAAVGTLTASDGIDYNSGTGNFSLDAATQTSLGLADTSLQPGDIAATITGTDNTTVAGEKAVKDYVTGLGYQTATDVSSYVSGLGYQTATGVGGIITTELGTGGSIKGAIDTAISGISEYDDGALSARVGALEDEFDTGGRVTNLENAGFQNSTQVSTAISSAIASSITGTDNTKAAGEKAVKDYVTTAISAAAYNDTALSGRVTTLEGKVGDSTAGLVKDTADLKTTVGNSSAGLVKDVADLKAAGYQTATDVGNIIDTELDTGGVIKGAIDTAVAGKIDNPECNAGQMLMANAGGGFDCIDIETGTYSE